MAKAKTGKVNTPQAVTPKIPGFYTTAEAARVLGLDKSRVDQFCRSGGPLVGKFQMAGIMRLFPVEVVTEFGKVERKDGPRPKVPTPSANGSAPHGKAGAKGRARPAAAKGKPQAAKVKAGKAPKVKAPGKGKPGKPGGKVKAGKPGKPGKPGGKAKRFCPPVAAEKTAAPDLAPAVAA